MKNGKKCLALILLFETVNAQNVQKIVKPGRIFERSVVVGSSSSTVAELEDVLLVQGLAAATTKLQYVVNAADGLRDAVPPVVAKNPKKSGVAKSVAAIAPVSKVEAVDQAAMDNFLPQYVQRLDSYIGQGGATAAPVLFDQGMQCLVNIARTPLLSEKGKDFLIKTALPKLKVRALDAKEVDAWLAIRPLFAPYQQKSGHVENFHPLQDVAVKALQSALTQCKSKQVHYVTARQLQEAVELVVGAVLRWQQGPALTKLASLDQFQQLAAAIADNEVLSVEIKVTAKTILESFMGVLSAVRAATTMITTQLAADQNAAPLVKIANVIGYMNKCDIALKGLSGAQDVYVDEGLQKLRNAFAQSLVEMQKKIVPDATAQFVALLQRAADTGLLGKVQRSYVLTQMLPAFDSEELKKAREIAMKRLGKPVVAKKKTKK